MANPDHITLSIGRILYYYHQNLHYLNTMRTTIHRTIILFAMGTLFSGCLTAFDTAQEARTISRGGMQLDGMVGNAETHLGIRYGIMEGWDVGLHYGINYYAPFIQGMSAVDTKVELIDHENYAFSTGIGFGTGSDYLPVYVRHKESQPAAAGLPASFFHPSLDILLPAYYTWYFNGNIVYANLFGIYRISDWEGNMINDIYPGFSVGVIDILKNDALRFNMGLTYIFYYATDVPYPNNNPKTYLNGYANIVNYSGGITWQFDPEEFPAMIKPLFDFHKKDKQ